MGILIAGQGRKMGGHTWVGWGVVDEDREKEQ